MESVSPAPRFWSARHSRVHAAIGWCARLGLAAAVLGVLAQTRRMISVGTCLTVLLLSLTAGTAARAACSSDVECDDGSLCTDDSCDPVAGCSSLPIVCDDGIACTFDMCDRALGCVILPVVCDDGNPCNGVETCEVDHCASSAPRDCSDSDPCTLDDCDFVLGCSNTPIPGCTTPVATPTCLQFVTEVDPFDCVEGRISELSEIVKAQVDLKRLRKSLLKPLHRATLAVQRAERRFYNEEEDEAEAAVFQRLEEAIRSVRKFQGKLDSQAGRRLSEATRELLGDMAEAVSIEIDGLQ